MKVKKFSRRKLFPGQVQYLEYAKKYQHTACLKEMRTGKTLSTIRWICGIGEEFWYIHEGMSNSYPILVIAPLSVLEAWEKELKLEHERYIVAAGLSFDKRTDLVVNEAFGQPGRTWVLANYDMIRCTPGLGELEWYAVVADESTHIKNPQAKITKIMTQGFRSAEHRTILAGLPAPEGELDLFCQFQFLHGEFMGCKNYYEYRNRFFELRWDGWQPKPGMAKKIKDEVHRISFILTRKTAGLGSVKIRENRTVAMSAAQKKAYKEVESDFALTLENNVRETDHVITQRMWLARIAGGCDTAGKAQMKWQGKTTELLKLLKGELSGEPVVVWFRFNSEIEAVALALGAAGVPFKTLTGADSREERKRKQDWFRDSKQAGRVMLSQIAKVAEYGVDMSVSSTAIYYSVTYSCLQMAQTEDRIMHPMKKEPLLYLYLVSEESIDEDAVELISKKLTSAKMFAYKMRKLFVERKNRK